jgi:hypothetical protein
VRHAFDPDYSVVTFATNKLNYVEFALNCARSILLFNDIRVYIISDLKFDLPENLRENVSIIKAKEEHTSLGIGIKLYTDQYLQTINTLFIDADCLVYDSLEAVFKACEGKNVSVAGTIVNAAEWVGPEQAVTIEKEFGIIQLPRFNGGLYYLKKGVKSGQIFDFARSIIPNYDRFGFSRIKNKWINEEGLIAISMMVHHEGPIPDDGSYMTDLYTDPHPLKLNVLKGLRILKNPAVGPKHRPWYIKGQYSPIILHFGGQSLTTFPYMTQNALLWLNDNRINKNLSAWLINLGLYLPYKLATSLLSFTRKLRTR